MRPTRPASLHFLQMWDRLALEKLHFCVVSILSWIFWERMCGRVHYLNKLDLSARSTNESSNGASSGASGINATQPIVISEVRARQGVTRHVRYVLGFGSGAIIALTVLYLFYFAVD